MNFEQVLYQVVDRVATITLNRPERLNAWNETLHAEVRQAVQMASADENVRCIVLTGAGRAFCAGADMDRLRAVANGTLQLASHTGEDGVVGSDLRYLLHVAKPMIAAINGPIAGVGVCIAAFCDLRLIATQAKLTTAYARRGVVAEFGLAWTLPRLIGINHANDLLLSGRTVEAPEVAAMGFASLLPDNDFAAVVQQRAAQLASQCSPRSQRIIKQQLALAWQQSLPQALDLAEQEFSSSLSSADFREGVAHFVEKRVPIFPD